MKLQQIVSNRRIDNHHANDLVYEWEDVIAQQLHLEIAHNHAWKNQRFSKYIPFLLNWLQTNKPAFAYEMCTYRHNGNNKRNIVPCIIDFYLRQPWQIYAWYAQYWRNPIVLVSSREVYEYLRSMGLQKVKHLALSISDSNRITPETRFNKRFDVLLVGRQNPVLSTYLMQYEAMHPEITIVRRTIHDGTPVYEDNHGQIVCDHDSREAYKTLAQQARIALYSTPGIDGGRNTHGFHQVTPRFLEIIAAGCHPIMRYVNNADTQYYELPSFGKHIETYEQFAEAMDFARSTEVNMERYARYLEQHYTSQRAQQLKELIAQL